MNFLKFREYEKAHQLLKDSDLTESIKKQVYQYYWVHLKGKAVEKEFYSRENNAYSKILHHLYQGMLMFYTDGDEINAIKEFNEVLEISLEIKDVAFACESLRRILEVYNNFSKTINDKTYTYFLNVYKNYQVDYFEQASYAYYEFRLKQRFYPTLELRFEDEVLKSYEQKILRPNFRSLYGKFLLTKATYFFHYTRQRDSAFILIGMAKDIFKRSKHFLDIERFQAASLNEINFRLKLNEVDRVETLFSFINIDTTRGYSFKLLKKFYLHHKWKSFQLRGLFDSTYFYKAEYFDYENYLNQRQNLAKISKLQADKKERQNIELKNQNLLISNKAKTNRNWLIAAGIVILLGTGITVLLQKNTIKKRLLAEQEVQLKQQRVENLLKEQELVSIDAMIAGQEKERQKVAGELHDDLGSLMATIKLHFDHANISEQDPALRRAQKLLEEAYQKVRSMAHSKNSGVMSDQGLLSALKKMAKTIGETNAMEVTVEDFGLGERMENSLELSIFRMIQELVANAIKHAEASRVNIQLTQHEENLNIIVEDNGKGFDRSQLDKESRGMGLTNIEKRVEHLEGNFTVDSVIGRGTSILIDIPV
ncbi:sensor histidine kinase [Muricauda sp. SCSIO 64092]|uniref:sensor histidine kinase n=1 Tax=Allomuricauda sp. SCSIO 64092 TaxID=2908842 RepID=UPI001FF5EC9F|nr:sensor histidine kinase [Muricauda sp. SCSIO 64092]UOY05379.1 sensor histidine kinase [Muricauda sp. SCSIO 64092]